MKLQLLVVLLGIALTQAIVHNHARGKKLSATHPLTSSEYDFTGCPYNNDFYYSGVLTSPFYPKNYPNNVKCWYYMHALPGSVLSFNFTHFDLESCCDFVTIYDGPTDMFPVLVQIGGPNSSVTKPQGVYHSSERFALVTFTTDPIVTQTGFSMTYDSVYTAFPCNRDILLGINAMGGLKTKANYLKQLNFIANNLIKSWTIGLDKVRVFINLQTDADYAIIYPATDSDMSTTAQVQATVLSLSDYADNVLDNDTTTDFNGMFRYLDSDLTIKPGDNGEREYTQKVVILFIANNPNDDQDYNEAYEYAHKMRTTDDTKVIIVGMGTGLDMKRIGALAYGEGFYFSADYDQLPTLTDKINKAICQGLNAGCGV